jgi:hypothetical protein
MTFAAGTGSRSDAFPQITVGKNDRHDARIDALWRRSNDGTNVVGVNDATPFSDADRGEYGFNAPPHDLRTH